MQRALSQLGLVPRSNSRADLVGSLMSFTYLMEPLFSERIFVEKGTGLDSYAYFNVLPSADGVCFEFRAYDNAKGRTIRLVQKCQKHWNLDDLNSFASNASDRIDRGLQAIARRERRRL